MADQRIEDLTELTSVDANDKLVILDISDTTDEGDGTTKQISFQNLHAYGEIRVEDNAVATAITGTQTDFGANAKQVLTFGANGASLNTTPDHTSDHIRIDVAGVYHIMLTASFSGEANDTYSFAIFKNDGATQLGSRATRLLGTGGDVGSASIQALAALDVNDTIEMFIQNEDGATNFDCTIEDASLVVYRVG